MHLIIKVFENPSITVMELLHRISSRAQSDEGIVTLLANTASFLMNLSIGCTQVFWMPLDSTHL